MVITGSTTSSTSNGGMFENIGTTTTTGTVFINEFSGGETITESFEFKKTHDGNFIEVVKRQKMTRNYHFTTGWSTEPEKDRVWKEIYGIFTGENGRQELQLIRTIEGKVTPAYLVEEDVEFDE